jgi:hypothetical protein
LEVIVSAIIHRECGSLESAGGAFQRVIRNVRAQNIFLTAAIVAMIQDDLPARLFFTFIAPYYRLRASAPQSYILRPVQNAGGSRASLFENRIRKKAHAAVRKFWSVILRCERSEPRRTHGPCARPNEIGIADFALLLVKSATADLMGRFAATSE